MAVIQFLKETKAEMEKVLWPTRRESVALTVLVIVISLIIAFYLGALDYVFTHILETYLL